MSLKNPTTKNNISPPLQNLSIRELFLYTKIPFHRLEAIARGEFKPNTSDRERLSIVSAPFYAMNELERQAFVQRKKYRTIRYFASFAEKGKLLSDPEKYAQRLEALLDKYWPEIILSATEK